MRVLITGGSGYLGAAIVRAAARAGHAPTVFARRASASGLPGVLVDGDVRDPAAVTAAARGVDAICHTAALVSLWRPRARDFDEVNVDGLRTVIGACLSLGIPRLVYTSTFLARPPADGTSTLAANDYQRTKVLAREVARAAAAGGAPIVSLFPGVIYGRGAITDGNLVGRLIQDHLARRLPGLVGADRPWSFAQIDQVADAHVAALTRGEVGAEYVLGGENAPPMRLFEILRDLRGTPLPRRIPFAVATALGYVEEAKAALFRIPPLVTRGVVEIFRHDWSLDSRTSADALGYATTPLAVGVRALLGEPPGPRP